MNPFPQSQHRSPSETTPAFPANPDRTRGRPYAVVYDGQCVVCGRLVRLLERWDTRGQLQMMPFQDPSVRFRFPDIPNEAYRESLQLIGPAGSRWEGSEAVEQLLGILPRGWLLGWTFALPLADRLADRIYRWFARNRTFLGCGTHCGTRAREREREGASG